MHWLIQGLRAKNSQHGIHQRAHPLEAGTSSLFIHLPTTPSLSPTPYSLSLMCPPEFTCWIPLPTCKPHHCWDCGLQVALRSSRCSSQEFPSIPESVAKKSKSQLSASISLCFMHLRRGNSLTQKSPISMGWRPMGTLQLASSCIPPWIICLWARDLGGYLAQTFHFINKEPESK